MESSRKGKWSRFAARVTNPPGLKWAFRSIVIAGVVALALDYFNTPIRAWLQYHVPFPGSGGKSAAWVAAEASANEQGEIDAEITQPAIAKAREAAMAKAAKGSEDAALHIGPYATLKRDVPFYGIDGGTSVPLYKPDDIKQDDALFSRLPQHMKAGAPVMPIYDGTGSLAQMYDYAMVWDGDQWGFVPMKDYNAASLPMKDNQQ